MNYQDVHVMFLNLPRIGKESKLENVPLDVRFPPDVELLIVQMSEKLWLQSRIFHGRMIV